VAVPALQPHIAGLSAAVVVVEAGKTGGALITAVKAAEYGIPVFAMPGDVDRATSEGTNRLIRDGAFPVFDPEDLVAELDLVHDLAGAAGRGDASSGGGC
jgi:DNA processing protein